jgi:hypothetical protein
MFIVNHPGPWQSYLNRPNNVGKPIMEVRDRYLQEQLLFENYMSFIHQQQMMMANASSGGGPKPTPIEDNTENEFVVNDYVENYFE